MKVGDFIQLRTEERVGGPWFNPKETRQHGMVLKFDTSRVSERSAPETVVEILWNTGAANWILKERIEVVNESR